MRSVGAATVQHQLRVACESGRADSRHDVAPAVVRTKARRRLSRSRRARRGARPSGPGRSSPVGTSCTSKRSTSPCSRKNRRTASTRRSSRMPARLAASIREALALGGQARRRLHDVGPRTHVEDDADGGVGARREIRTPTGHKSSVASGATSTSSPCASIRFGSMRPAACARKKASKSWPAASASREAGPRTVPAGQGDSGSAGARTTSGGGPVRRARAGRGRDAPAEPQPTIPSRSMTDTAAASGLLTVVSLHPGPPPKRRADAASAAGKKSRGAFLAGARGFEARGGRHDAGTPVA